MLKKNSSFKSINKLQSKTLNHLHQKINVQKQLTQRIKDHLPEALAKQVVHCVTRDSSLLLYTHSANWASQLRFYNDTIIKAAGGAIKTLQTKVINKAEPSNTKIRLAVIPSTEKIEFIRTYSKLIRDSQLQAALLRLSSTLTRLSSGK